LGKENDFDRAFERFYAPVRSKSGRILANPQTAEDVTQEVFLRLWQWEARPALDAPDGPRTLLAWLYRTCTRLAIDTLRAARRSPRASDAADEAASRLPCGADLATAIAARTAIAALAGTAEDAELEAAILCRVDGLSQPEAALVLETSERTLRRLLARFDERIDPIRREFAS
jgi:RNA polymerase sigma-70 factor (ECF subfamily)